MVRYHCRQYRPQPHPSAYDNIEIEFRFWFAPAGNRPDAFDHAAPFQRKTTGAMLLDQETPSQCNTTPLSPTAQQSVELTQYTLFRFSVVLEVWLNNQPVAGVQRKIIPFVPTVQQLLASGQWTSFKSSPVIVPVLLHDGAPAVTIDSSIIPHCPARCGGKHKH